MGIEYFTHYLFNRMNKFFLRDKIREIIEEAIVFPESVDYDHMHFIPENATAIFAEPEYKQKCSTFNVEELKKINSWAGKMHYLEGCLHRLGKGSSRAVYLLEPTKVIKLAINKKGIAQNEHESDLKDGAAQYSDVMAQIIDYDENYLWVEMEVAKKLDFKLFRSITGLSFRTFSNAMWRIGMSEMGYQRYYDDIPEEVKQNEFFQEIEDCANYLGITASDLQSKNQWGMVTRDGMTKIVIIDYGLNNRIYNDYYKKKVA